MLKYVPVKLIGTKSSITIYALLDDGSTVSIINSRIVKAIGFMTKMTNVSLKGIGDESAITIANEKVDLKIRYDCSDLVMENVLVVEKLSLPEQEVPVKLSQFCKTETGIWVNPYKTSPDLLIGQSHTDLLIMRDYREIKDYNITKLVISRSLLGWVIHGRYNESKLEQINIMRIENSKKICSCNNSEMEKINDQLKRYFEIETLGVSNFNKSSSDDRRAIEILDRTSKHINGSWEVGLLWKNDDDLITNGRSTALRRSELLTKKLNRDSEYAKLYHKEIARLFDNNFAQKVTNKTIGPKIFYLPHFGVQNINKPGKLRLVFDAAAKTSNVSLNDMLLPGPDLLKSLLGILMRFRQFYYAVKSDLKDMFLKIKIREEDRHAQRFFWEGQECVMITLLFGAMSSPCTALYIKNKNASLFLPKYPDTAYSLIENCYMDDFLDSCKTLEEAKARVSEAIEINKHANWEMHGWASNCCSIIANVNSGDRADKPVMMKNEQKIEKILGLHWLNSSDELAFKINENKILSDVYSGTKIPTKREFLSIIMSVFDPLGFLTPFTIHSRILMQDIWASKIGWDEKLQQKEFLQWKKWLNDFEKVKNCRVNRCYQIKLLQQNKAELHVFCDASSKAYTAVAYWRFLLPDNTFHIAFIMSKSRVAPKSNTTIPRLELQAAVLATKLAKLITKEHDIQVIKRFFWSDSSTVIHWINKDPREYKIFVANRLAEICENSKPSEWRWVSTKDNPADDGTRYASDALNNDSRWFLGPEFLKKNEIQWPKTEFVNIIEKERVFNLEIKDVLSCNVKFDPIIDFSRFSKLNRLLNTATEVLKAIDLMRKIKREPLDRKFEAELICLKISQYISFPDEINALKMNKPISKRSHILKFNPKLDKHGVLRCEGRIRKFVEANFTSNPAILDSKEKFSQFLLSFYHSKFYHVNHESVINEIRQKYWIIGLRRSLRHLIYKCVECRLQRGKPANPKMGDVPSARLAYRMRPFSHSGLDFFGPIEVTIGRRREKRYGVLFTCMTVRAIHIELAHSLTTDSAIMALKRFIARRGRPFSIYCDNAKNLRGMSKELENEMKKVDYNQILEFTTQNDIKFKFNPPSSPFMGGAWEILIRSVKRAMSVALKYQAPREEILLTALMEIEHCVNSRPLTFVSSDPDDREALTPNHFLLGASSGEIRFGRCDAQTLNSKKHWQTAQHFADVFWRRWLKEFLPALNELKKWCTSNEPLKIGDVILVLEENIMRNHWKKGVITRTLPGPDNEIRVVEVRTANGSLIRPDRKIIPLIEVKN